MSNELLQARNAPTPATAESDMELELRVCQAIAGAGDAIPAAYRGKPGAVFIAREWGRQRGIDLLTTMQTVAFISGKPIVDASLQRSLAKRAGYDVEITYGDDWATCTVKRNGEAVGTSTYTMTDARTAGLANKDNWKKNQRAMLVARATAQTMRWHAPEVLLGVFTEDEIDTPIDDLGPIEATATVDPEPVVEGEARQEVEGQTTVEEQIAAAEAEPVDAEVVETKATPATKGKAAAGIESVRSFHMYQQLVEAMNAEGIPIAKTSWTQAQATRVIILCDQLIAQAQEPEGAGS